MTFWNLIWYILLVLDNLWLIVGQGICTSDYTHGSLTLIGLNFQGIRLRGAKYANRVYYFQCTCTKIAFNSSPLEGPWDPPSDGRYPFRLYYSKVIDFHYNIFSRYLQLLQCNARHNFYITYIELFYYIYVHSVYCSSHLYGNKCAHNTLPKIYWTSSQGYCDAHLQAPYSLTILLSHSLSDPTFGWIGSSKID